MNHHNLLVCEAIELEGELLPKGAYDLKDLEERGYIPSHGILSDNCYKVFLLKEGVTMEEIKEDLKEISSGYDSCPTPINQ